MRVCGGKAPAQAQPPLRSQQRLQLLLSGTRYSQTRHPCVLQSNDLSCPMLFRPRVRRTPLSWAPMLASSQVRGRPGESKTSSQLTPPLSFPHPSFIGAHLTVTITRVAPIIANLATLSSSEPFNGDSAAAALFASALAASTAGVGETATSITLRSPSSNAVLTVAPRVGTHFFVSPEDALQSAADAAAAGLDAGWVAAAAPLQ